VKRERQRQREEESGGGEADSVNVVISDWHGVIGAVSEWAPE
jgi:hypothetical protein